jgi:hypothetical protein
MTKRGDFPKSRGFAQRIDGCDAICRKGGNREAGARTNLIVTTDPSQSAKADFV